jgi:hypothetical protein
MKRLLVVIFSIIFALSIGLTGVGCEKTVKAAASGTPLVETTTTIVTQTTTSETTISEDRVIAASPGTSDEDTTAGWKTYTNDEYGFEFKCPEGSQINNTFEPYNHLSDKWRVGISGDTYGKPAASIIVLRIENESTYPRYFAAELRIGVSSDPQDLASYVNPSDIETAAEPPVEVINGISFNKFIIHDAAMMQYIEGISYRTVNNGICFAIEQIKTGSNYRDQPSPNDIPDAVLDFNYNIISNIIKTFKFIDRAVIVDSAILGIMAPVKGETPIKGLETPQYTSSIVWNGNPVKFAASMIYTATITITPKAGYTLKGVPENYFKVWGSINSATNTVNSGVVTVVFPATAPLAIGDSYGGGIVAYILVAGNPGYSETVKHGIIAAIEDQNGGGQVFWSDKMALVGDSAQGTAIGTGAANTDAIISQPKFTTSAAKICRDYRGGGFTDWSLPSKDELHMLYLNRALIGGFGQYYYWSSSEMDVWPAWVENFGNGLQDYHYKDSYNKRVRAIRYF